VVNPHAHLLYDHHQQRNQYGVAMIALKIVNCDDSKKWYASLVGETVPLLDVEENEFKSREPDGYINFVSKDDAEIIHTS